MKRANRNREVCLSRIFLPRAFELFILVLPVIILTGYAKRVVETDQHKPLKTIIWKLENPALVGGFHPVILGAPSIIRDKRGSCLSFDGVDDGLIIPINPVQNWSRFTVEILFKPAGDGPSAPRFMHFQDTAGNRGTLELRVDATGHWYLDTFLKNGQTGKGLALIDSTKIHSSGEWYWAALVYDGKKMVHYVNGVKELEGVTGMGPMGKGEISLGVRLNQVSWFKGLIKEVRFHPAALVSKMLSRP